MQKVINMVACGLELLGVLINTGCSEALLDYDKRGATTTETFYKTDGQAMEALMAVFDSWQYYTGYNIFIYLNALSDECYAGGGYRGDNSAIEELNEFTFTASNRCIEEMYSAFYQSVYRANLVIDHVDPDSEVKRLCIATAKAMRAYSYFYLVNLWGDVPLILHELNVNEYNQPRTDRALVFGQIEKDLVEAIAMLPVRSRMAPGYQHLLAKGAAQAMLGKAYLYEQRYKDAAATLDQVIESGEYSLYPDYQKILRVDSEYGVESLLEIAFVNNLNYPWWPGSESNGGGYMQMCFFMLSPRQNYFYCPSLDIIPYWGFLNPHRELYEAFTSAEDLVRRNASIIAEDSIISAGGQLRNSSNALPYGNDGYIRTKYVMRYSEGDPSNPTSAWANIGTNFRLIRYADVLLMAAEANNRMEVPNDLKAIEYLNRVRSRASLTPVTLGAEDLFNAIKLERRLELAFEGQRFMDLVRWGEAYHRLKDQGKSVPLGNGRFFTVANAGFTSRNVLLPIPEYERIVNGSMTQNYGY